MEETYDAVVVGAGHAGCEAALALARLGFYTALFTVSVDIGKYAARNRGYKACRGDYNGFKPVLEQNHADYKIYWHQARNQPQISP